MKTQNKDIIDFFSHPLILNLVYVISLIGEKFKTSLKDITET